jgi:hypothetical protein
MRIERGADQGQFAVIALPIHPRRQARRSVAGAPGVRPPQPRSPRTTPEAVPPVAAMNPRRRPAYTW